MSAKPTLARSDRDITLNTFGCFFFAKTLAYASWLCYTIGTLINERISMTVSVEYKPSLDYLSKVEGSFGIHSRLNKDHYTSCQACMEDHLDLLQDIEQDEE